MRVMVFVKATADSEAGLKSGPEMEKLFEEMGKYNQQLIDAGIMKDGDGLKPTSAAVRIAFDGSNRTVKKGPFSQNNPSDLVAGFWIWEVKDMDEAIEWAKKCPNPMPGPSDLEIRPCYQAEDFEGIVSPEAQKRSA